MDLKSLLKSLEPTEEERSRQENLRAQIDSVRGRLSTRPESVRQDETIAAISDSFWEFGSIPDDLLQALPFTHKGLVPDTLPRAWETYLDSLSLDCRSRFAYPEFPLLLEIANWYLDEKEGYEVNHALAIYEYLYQNLKEPDSEYRHHLGDFIPDMVRAYSRTSDHPRTVYLMNVVAEEYQASRLDEESYLSVLKLKEDLIAESRGASLSSDEQDLLHINRTLWATIGQRDRTIEALSDERLQLLGQLARARDGTVFNQANESVRTRFGELWCSLDKDARNHFALAEVLCCPPYSEMVPGTAASAFYKAVNREIWVKVFESYRRSHEDFVDGIAKRFDAISSLIYALSAPRNDIGWNLENSAQVRKALKAALVEPEGVLVRDHINRLKFLKGERNKDQHPESRGTSSSADLEKLVQCIWKDNWLLVFLKLFQRHSDEVAL